MRPDEHKKKKNATYKKKHGITKEDNKTKSDNVDGKSKYATDKFKLTPKDTSRSNSKPSDRKSASAQQKPHRHGARVPGAAAADLKDSSDSESNSSSECEGTVKQKTYAKKTFQRREIVSNWQKYEITPDVEETPGGNSYEKLLSVAGGGALSHFRFKDELEWEEESSGSVSQAGDEIYNQVFGFNPSELANCLACLPIHQVLGIETDVFSVEQLAENTTSANEKLSLWSKDNDGRNEKLSNLTPDKLSTETARTSKAESSINVMNSSSSQSGARQTAGTSPIENIVLPNTKKEPVENSETQTSHNVRAPSFSQSSTCQDSKRSSTTDKALPSPISLSEKIPLEEGPVSNSISGDSSSELSSCLSHQLILEDNVLDSLLDLDAPDSQQHPVISTDAGSVTLNIPENSKQSKIDSETRALPKAVEISSKEKTEVTDLEDWLDSILDD